MSDQSRFWVFAAVLLGALVVRSLVVESAQDASSAAIVGVGVLLGAYLVRRSDD